MTDPERLLSSTDDDFERRILRTARRDVGSEESLRRTLGALSVAAGAGAGAAAAKAAAAAPLHGAGAGAAGAASIGKIVGFVAIGAALGTLATGGTVWVFAPARPAATAPVEHAESPSLRPAQGTNRSAEALHDTPPESTARPSDDAPSGREMAGSAVPTSRASVNPTPTDVRQSTIPSLGNTPEGSALSSELGALEGVRGSLDRGRPALALELLDTYEGRFPNGVLRQEAVVLRIDALTKMGDRTTASGLAKRFLASHPGTPHAAHLKALIAEQRQ